MSVMKKTERTNRAIAGNIANGLLNHAYKNGMDFQQFDTRFRENIGSAHEFTMVLVDCLLAGHRIVRDHRDTPLYEYEIGIMDVIDSIDGMSVENRVSIPLTTYNIARAALTKLIVGYTELPSDKKTNRLQGDFLIATGLLGSLAKRYSNT